MNKISAFLVSVVILSQQAWTATSRSRALGVVGVEASNTVGLGDIWVTVGSGSYFRIRPVTNATLSRTVDSTYRNDFRLLYGSGDQLHRDMLTVPTVSGALGLANFMHLEFDAVPWDGVKIGATTARLKITTPGNDNLRLIGLAVMLNATLSTEEDTYSKGETTPGFDPLLYYSAIADLDLLKLFHSFPVKLYANYSSLDDYRLVHAYTQHQFRGAIEYMGNRKGWYMRGGMMLYKPLATKFNPDPIKEFLPPIYEFGLGYRANFGDRFTFTADFSMDPIHPISFYNDETGKPPKLQVGIEAPLLWTETRTEAIRALIFNEEQRKHYREMALKNDATNKNGANGSMGSVGKNGKMDSAKAVNAAVLKVDEISLEDRKATQSKDVFKEVFDEGEGDVAEKRKAIRSELKQIEDLIQ